MIFKLAAGSGLAVLTFALIMLPNRSPIVAADPQPLDRPAASSYPFVIWGPDGAIARIAIPTQTPIPCPNLQLNNSPPQAMQIHAAPTLNFPVQVCQLGIPKNVTSASINQQPLPIPKANPKNFLVIGDTGCRIEGNLQQSCNNPQQWPFAQLAQSAAMVKPDLVIHVGDYYYREGQCSKNPDCAGSPYGDQWVTWEADLFKPARPLMAAAPWVVIRGNHEDCKRGGEGWFHLLDPRPKPAQCPDYTDPYAVPAGPLNLVVLDSSLAADSKAPPAQVQQYRTQFQTIAKLTKKNTWLLTHRPIWAFATATNPLNDTLQKAVKDIPLPGIQQVLSGHVHLFASFSFRASDHRPAQLVIGHGGTLLNYAFPSPQGKIIDGAPVDQAFVLSRFGFLTLQTRNSTPKNWTGKAYDPTGTVFATCELDGRTTICR
uniref:Metallophosphoesterase n=1 Tax=Cyanothece sp. (strain PCC 7425 / ATCC 29141) TaxID=395961 RepID=B8HQ43_CYAP4